MIAWNSIVKNVETLLKCKKFRLEIPYYHQELVKNRKDFASYDDNDHVSSKSKSI